MMKWIPETNYVIIIVNRDKDYQYPAKITMCLYITVFANNIAKDNIIIQFSTSRKFVIDD